MGYAVMTDREERGVRSEEKKAGTVFPLTPYYLLLTRAKR